MRRLISATLASRATPAVLLFLLGLAVYYRVLGPGLMIADGDLVFHVEPYHAYLAAAWAEGRWLPLWEPHLFLGAPYLANIQGSPLYPMNLLLLVLPTVRALNWMVALHTGIAGVGMYLYCLVGLRLGRAGSTVAGLVYMLSAYMFSHVGHFNQLLTLPWTPWLMFAADRAAAVPRPARLAGVAAVTALILLAGHTQQSYFAFVLASLVVAARLWSVAIRHRRWTRLARTGVLLSCAVALGAGLAALQLAATVELAGQSIRGGGLSLEAAGSFSLPFRGVVGDLLPDYLSEHRAEYASSVGAAALVLAALALVARRRLRVWVWAAAALLGLVIAFGPKARLYDVLYLWLPGYDLFRVPARILLFTTIGGAVLAGHGTRTAWQLTLAWRRPRWRRRILATLGGALALAGLAVVLPLGVLLAGNPQQGVFRMFPVLQPQNLALMAGFEAAATLVVLAGVAWRRALVGLLPAVVCADMLLLATPTYPMHPLPEDLQRASGVTAALVPHSLDERHLVLVPFQTDYRPVSGVPPGLTPYERGRYEWFLDQREAQVPNLSLITGARDADGYDGGVLPLRSYVAFRAGVLPPGIGNPPDYSTRMLTQRVGDPGWLDLAGVTTVVTTADVDPNPPGSSRLVPASRIGNLVAWHLVAPTPSRARLDDGRQAHVVQDTGERVVVRLPDGASGRLVLADSYFPGWTAAADGRPVAIERHAGYLRAVDLPPGSREVVFEYRPAWLAPALALNLAALLLTIALAAAPLVGVLRHRLRP